MTSLAAARFTGKERDAESGLDYFGARYYASSMGRFMSPDWSAKVEPVPYSKLDDPQTLNQYAYVTNNPMTRVDADGHTGVTNGLAMEAGYAESNFYNPNFIGESQLQHDYIQSAMQSVYDGAGQKEEKPILVQGKLTRTGANNGYINVLWTLKHTRGKLYYVTEQQSVHRLAQNPSGSGRTTDYPNQFDDDIGTVPMKPPVDSYQTFSISLSAPDKNGWSKGSMHVDVLIDDKQFYGVHLHLDATEGGPGTSETGVNPPGYSPQ